MARTNATINAMRSLRMAAMMRGPGAAVQRMCAASPATNSPRGSVTSALALETPSGERATTRAMARPDRIPFSGRILYLTEDAALLQRQLGGEDLPWDPTRKLIDNISTDEITPGWVCFYY